MNDEQPDVADLITRIKDQRGVTETEIAKRIGVHVSSVNNWVHRKSTPRPEALHALAREFPEVTAEEMFAAAGRKTTEPVSPEVEVRLLQLFRSLTSGQQAMVEIQLRGLVRHNQGNGITP
ncbi:helix-turn-helix transcriptional regulator [Streptomyces sp. NPDC046862]|uniref:helix-turn-helix domain-containing protein n=1 Tax=Streptomyces sp. NPDC046862 TaxID=3154603 RepID=UPI0034532517